MPLNRQTILQRLHAVRPFLQERYGVEALALFGSFAREEQTEKSDIDLLLTLAKPDFRAFSAAAQVLTDLFPERRVEVVSRGAIRPDYWAQVLPDLAYA